MSFVNGRMLCWMEEWLDRLMAGWIDQSVGRWMVFKGGSVGWIHESMDIS